LFFILEKMKTRAYIKETIKRDFLKIKRWYLLKINKYICFHQFNCNFLIWKPVRANEESEDFIIIINHKPINRAVIDEFRVHSMKNLMIGHNNQVIVSEMRIQNFIVFKYANIEIFDCPRSFQILFLYKRIYSLFFEILNIFRAKKL
jgi:hypothetical protein